MKYIIYDDGERFIILEAEAPGLYTYFAECEKKAAAEKLVESLNSAGAK